MSELSRLRWLCRRGMKELDIVLTRYLDERYAAAEADEQALFRQLLQMPDPDLYNLLLGRERPGDPGIERLLRRLQR
jgi:antitoxin CptB